MIFRSNEKRFMRQLAYYAVSNYSKRNLKKLEPLAGYSFDVIHDYVSVFGAYEMLELEVVREFINKKLDRKKLALDVGANIGNHTARLLSKEFESVLCFEPNPKIYKLLSLNMEAFENVRVHNFGLSNERKKLEFMINKNNWGGSKIVETDLSKATTDDRFMEIEVYPLDEVKLEEKVDLIKVDIEGHEFSFLKGARNTISNDKPIIIFEEGSIDASGSSQVISFLRDLGYKFYALEENFNFGSNRIKRMLRYLMQDIFGIRVKIVEKERFEPGFYNMIIAQHS